MTTDKASTPSEVANPKRAGTAKRNHVHPDRMNHMKPSMEDNMNTMKEEPGFQFHHQPREGAPGGGPPDDEDDSEDEKEDYELIKR